MASIFISYSHRDRQFAERVSECLKQARHRPFLDQDVSAGENWHERIGSELEKADVVIVLWSRASVESSHCQHEASVGLHQKKLLPILIDEVDIPLGFHSIQHLSLKGWTGTASDERWVQALNTVNALGSAKARDQQLTPSIEVARSADQVFRPLPRANSVSIFIAHASSDKSRLGGIVDALDTAGFPMWIDKPHLIPCCDAAKRRIARIHMGDDWKESIRKAVSRADKVIAFWSNDAIDGKREQFQYEVYQGLVQRKLFQCKLDPMPQDKIGTPYTFHQIADLSDFEQGKFHFELDYVMRDLIKARLNFLQKWLQ